MHITQLWIYPLKSARGVPVAEAEVVPRGLEGDRRWMLVDAEGRFVSQREEPRLALVEARLHAEGITLHVPDAAPIRIAAPETAAARRPVRIWKDEVPACAVPEAATAALSRFLDRTVQLVYMDAPARRPVDPDYGTMDDEVSFADGYPLLLTNTASLDALNDRLDDPITMARFRPNVVVEGKVPFEEDGWTRVHLGGVTFRVVKPCARCAITTVDPATGETGKEPLRTLNTFRRRGSKVFFGQNLIPDGPGPIRVGDAVQGVARTEGSTV